MDLFDVAHSCRRRWYVTIPTALLTLGLAGLAYVSVPTVYQATSVVGFAPSPITGGEGNGIINNGGTIMLANLTAAGISSPEIPQGIEESTGATDFDSAVVTVPGGQMPMLNLVASALDRGTAVAAVDQAQQRAETELNRIQASAGIPEKAFGVIYQVSARPDVEVLRPDRGKLVAGIVGLGLIISVLAGLLWDVAKTRRQPNDQSVGDEESSTSPERDGAEDKVDTPDARRKMRVAEGADERPDPAVRWSADRDGSLDSETLKPQSRAENWHGGDVSRGPRR